MEVGEDSPAAGAGLQPGDWITAIDGAAVGGDSGTALGELIGSQQPGDSISVEFQRDGEAMTATIALGAHPDDAAAPMLGIRYWSVPTFGSMQEYFDALRERFERHRGLTPQPDSDAMPEADTTPESSDQKDAA